MRVERPPPAIHVAGLSRAFGGRPAVNSLDLTVETGEFFSLLGPNGAGKTTTVRMLCCVLRPTDGTATVVGHDIRTDPLSVKRVIAVSPQETAVAGRLSVVENLMLMAGMHDMDRRAASARAADLVDLMSLGERAREQARRLSGGMKRRLSIAMALISSPRVLFLDEPTLGLDPQARRAMWEHITGLKGSTTIVLTTHYLEEADALADRVAIIDEGRIVALGTPVQLKAGIGAGQVTVVEADHLTGDAVDALRRMYSTVRVTAGGVEIEGDGVRLYDIEDCLRPRGVVIQSTYRKQITLDDVFLHLTGRQLRE